MSDADRETAGTVFRLADYFQTPRRTILAVHGVGSTVDESGRRVPLLVLDQSLSLKHRSLVERLFRGQHIGPAFLVGSRSRLLVPLRKAGPEVRTLLEEWNVPEDTRILFSAPPQPLQAGPGTRIWSRRKEATLGFRVRVGSRTVFSTAGHLVEELPCSVVIRSRRLFGEDRIEELGKVRFWNDPKTPLGPGAMDGVDVAIVEPLSRGVNGRDQAAILAHPPAVPDLAAVILLGARSHHRRGWINGALQVTRALDGRIWKNCWTIVGFRGGFAKQGDSGGPVILEQGAVLGHLVCALGTKGWTGRFQCGLVQDIHNVVEYMQSKYEVFPVILQPELNF